MYNNKRTRRFKSGGRLVDDKKAMVLSQIKEVHHHADELAKVLANMDTVDAWVVGKMERATTDLSDITHYLDGTTEYAKGGRIGKYILTFYCNESNIDEAEKIVSKYTKEWRRSLDFGKNFFFVPELTWQKAKELENEISPFKLPYPFGVSIFKAYADGGMMAKGGRIKDSDIKVGSKFVLVNGDIIEVKRLFVENRNEDWCEYTRNGVSQENSVKQLRLFINRLDGGMMAKGGNVSIKEGDKVIYEGEKRTVYALYPEGMASLCLIDDEDDYEYEDVEEDYQVSIKDLTPVKGSKKKNKQGIDLFEDYQDIPPKVQKVLDKYQEDIEDGDYKGLEKALKELEKIGYTFEYGLDGIAYDLRPIGTQGKSEFMEF